MYIYIYIYIYIYTYTYIYIYMFIHIYINGVPSSACKPSLECGLDCLGCAIFARQRLPNLCSADGFLFVASPQVAHEG